MYEVYAFPVVIVFIPFSVFLMMPISRILDWIVRVRMTSAIASTSILFLAERTWADVIFESPFLLAISADILRRSNALLASPISCAESAAQ